MIDKNKILKEIQKFVAKSQWDKAISEYEKLVKDSPGDTNSHNAIGDLYLKKNDPDNAILSYTKAADIFAKSGFTLKAIALYKKIQNIKPDQVDVLITLGKLNAERGLIGNANESYLAAASYFSRQGQKNKAIDVYKTLCDLNPDNLSLAQKLADLYLSEGFEKEAVSKYIELAERNISKGDLAEARNLLETAEAKGSERFDFIRVSAMLDLKSNRFPEAIKKLEHAFDVDPTDTRIGFLMSEAYQRSGRYEECGSVLASLVEKDPNNLHLRKQLAEVNVKAGDYDSAWNQYHFMIERHISNGQLAEAEQLVQEYLAIMPEDIAARHILISIYSKTGQEKETDNVHEEIAGLYLKAGDELKAENIYRKLLEKDPSNERINEKLASIVHGQKTVTAEASHTETNEPFGEEILLEENVFHAEEELPEPQGFNVSLEDIPSGEEIASDGGTSLYELPELTDDLNDFADIQNFDAGGPAEEDEEETAGNIIEIPDEDLGDIDDLDIFNTSDDGGAASESVEPQMSQEILVAPPVDDVFDLGSSEDEELFQAQERTTPSLDEQLAEIEVYIKYGLTNKAEDTLARLDAENPGNISIKEQYIEFFKSMGDIEGFVGASMELADLYQTHGDLEVARKIIEKAHDKDPENENLKVRLLQLSGPSVQPLDIEEAISSTAPPVFDFETVISENAFPEPEAGYAEEVSEADFYVQQGLRDEAKLIYLDILKSNPDDSDVKAKYEALEEHEKTGALHESDFSELSDPEQALPSSEPEMSLGGGVESSYKSVHDEFDAAFSDISLPEKPSKDESDFFDLAAELQDELDEEITKAHSPSEVFSDKQLESVFQEFKRGVEEQLNKEDYETHYNLGIAYKEMGMLDEALSEFGLAAKDPARTLDCASMLGLCFIEKGDYDKAAEHFRAGLDVGGHQPEEYAGLKYDLATAYELKGDLVSAQSIIDSIVKEVSDFRDVKDRLKRLNKALIETGTSPAEGNKEAADNKPDEPKPTPKKSRVSYL